MKIIFIDQIAKVNYKYSFSLINELKNRHDITMILDEKKYCDEKVKTLNLFNNITNKNISKTEKTITYIKAWNDIWNKCKKENIDVIHIQWFILSPIDLIYLTKIKKNGIKIIVTVHDILPFNEKIYDYISHKKIYNLADKIIVQAKANVEIINRKFEDINEKVIYIPHGNFIDHVEEIDMDEAKKRLEIEENKKIILFFGQIKKVKGLDILIKAFAEVLKRTKDENLILLIAGKVWEDNFGVYQKIIDDLDIKENVRCDIEYIPDEKIGCYYSASSINVLPYKELYQSGVVHLAYAYKTPVIASNVGSFPEVIINGESGILIEKENIEQLADAICKIIYDEKRLVEMGIKGRRFIEENFSWEKISREISRVYE